MNIAIGIITKNRSKKLYRLLFSLAPQLKKNHKVFILENGSNLITNKEIQKIGIKNFELIKKRTGNIPKSRNHLLLLARNEYDILLFIDDDCIASKNWIQEYEKYFKNKKINIIQGAINGIPSDNIFAKLSDLLFKLWLSKNSINNTTRIIDTKNVGIKLKILKNFKFDENIKSAEDIELAARLSSKKIKINYLNSSLVFHEERLSTKEFIKHRVRLSDSYRNITHKHKNHFKSAGIIEKYLYLWKYLEERISKKIFALSVLTLSYFLVLIKSIPWFSGYSKP